MDTNVAQPPVGGTRAFLQSLIPSLVPSEQRVAQACVDDPKRIITMSVAELAKHTDTSPATVVRACKRMGFRGYQHLRELLLRDQAATRPSSARPTPQHPVAHLFTQAIEEIDGALGALDLQAFDAAAEAIRTCKRLLIVGNGASLAPAQSIALHFLVSGKVCESPADIVTQHVSAKLLKPGDVCLAVSDSGMNAFTLRSAALANESGATLIAITSFGKSDLATLADHALIAGAGARSWTERTVPANIVQMLLLTVLHAAALDELPGTRAARAEALDEVHNMVISEHE